MPTSWVRDRSGRDVEVASLRFQCKADGREWVLTMRPADGGVELLYMPAAIHRQLIAAGRLFEASSRPVTVGVDWFRLLTWPQVFSLGVYDARAVNTLRRWVGENCRPRRAGILHRREPFTVFYAPKGALDLEHILCLDFGGYTGLFLPQPLSACFLPISTAAHLDCGERVGRFRPRLPKVAVRFEMGRESKLIGLFDEDEVLRFLEGTEYVAGCDTVCGEHGRSLEDGNADGGGVAEAAAGGGVEVAAEESPRAA